MLLQAEHPIDSPAAADVLARTEALTHGLLGTEAVSNELLVRAPGVLKGVGQDGQQGRRVALRGRSRQPHDWTYAPARVEGDGAKWVAEELVEPMRAPVAGTRKAIAGSA